MADEAGSDEGEMEELDVLMKEYERQAQEDCAKAIRPTRKKQTPEERLEETLKQPLPKDNKGHQLLTKMGYSEGEGLGARRQGRVEPVPLPAKRRREGLGSVVEAKRRADRAKTREKEDVTGEDAKSYRQEMSSRNAARGAAKRLRAARRLIETLDTRRGTERNRFWMIEEDDDEAVDPLEKTAFEDAYAEALAYLREEHCYCFWCGCQYQDVEDLGAGCPGLEEEDH